MDFSKLLAQIDSVTTTKKTYDDDTADYYRLTTDKAGNASAVIRFLPDADIEDIPFVRRFKHAFKNEENNRWYIEFSLSTIGEQDYISQVNSELWNTGIDENKEIVRKQKRKLEFISNIYIVKDAANPEMEGKVMKFKYGKKIFDKIIAAAKPDESLGEDPINAFDPHKGADFILKQKRVSDYPNYDESRFGSAKPMFGGDDTKIDAVLGKCYSLKEEIAPSKFKSKEELERKFKWVMGITDSPKAAQKQAYDEELDTIAESVKADVEKATPKVTPKKTVPTPTESPTDDDDDAFFKSLIED